MIWAPQGWRACRRRCSGRADPPPCPATSWMRPWSSLPPTSRRAQARKWPFSPDQTVWSLSLLLRRGPPLQSCAKLFLRIESSLGRHSTRLWMSPDRQRKRIGREKGHLDDGNDQGSIACAITAGQRRRGGHQPGLRSPSLVVDTHKSAGRCSVCPLVSVYSPLVSPTQSCNRAALAGRPSAWASAACRRMRRPCCACSVISSPHPRCRSRRSTCTRARCVAHSPACLAGCNQTNAHRRPASSCHHNRNTHVVPEGLQKRMSMLLLVEPNGVNRPWWPLSGAQCAAASE